MAQSTATETSNPDATTSDRRERRLWTVEIMLFVALSGLGMQMRGALLPTLAEQWGVSDGLLGLVGPAGTVGYVVTVLAVGVVAGRINTRRYILGGLVIILVGVLGMAAAPFFFAFLGFLTLRGLGTGVVRGLDRPMLSHFYPESRGRVFNLYDLAWAIGAAAGPAVMTLAISMGDWRLAYYGLAVAFTVVLLFVWRLDTPEDGDEKPLEIASALRLLKTPAIAAMALALAFHSGLEGAMFLWLPTFGERVAGLSTGAANLLLSVFIIAYIPGRVFYSYVTERVGYSRLVLTIEALVVPVFYWTFFVAEGQATFVGVAVLGVLVSGIFPTVLAFGTEAAPEYSAPVNAIAMATGSATLALVPWLLGILIEAYSIRPAMWLPLALTVAVGPIVLLAGRVDPNL